MKKAMTVAAVLLLVLCMLTGCNRQGSAFEPTREIGVTTREKGSGTRGAFIELFGIEQKNEAGEKEDRTKRDAVETNNTAVMMTTVAGDRHAIGYISLGSVNDTVKALKIDGVEASVENVKNGSYKVVRPFNVATKQTMTPAARDFLDFIMSADGQKIIENQGYIPVAEEPKAYAGSVESGKVVIGGSSSVTPVMEKLAAAYEAKNDGVTVEINQSDSSSGMTDTVDGICDIGMASRELKDSETAKGLLALTIAQDGIAVIVNNDCAVDGLSAEQVMKIYTGAVTRWNEVING